MLSRRVHTIFDLMNGLASQGGNLRTRSKRFFDEFVVDGSANSVLDEVPKHLCSISAENLKANKSFNEINILIR